MKRALVTLLLFVPSLVAQPAVAAPSCAGHTGTIVGTAHGDVLTGTPEDDVIIGGRGSDTLIGLGGNDRLCGGRGRDSLFGGDGADLMVGGRGADVLLGGPGNDFLDGGRDADEVSYLFSAEGMRVDLQAGRARGEGQDLLRRIERVVGSAGSDRLLGSERDEHLAGDSGKDVLRGRAGRDTLEGGRGDDDLGGGGGTDVAIFDAARAGVEASLTGASGEGTDTLGGIEDLIGTRFGDRLTGDEGANALSGSSGYDRLIGGAGNDRLSGDLDGAEADAGEGIDACIDTDASITCESSGSTSRAPTAETSVPWPGALLPSGELERIRGRTLGAVREVRIAIRLLTPDGCAWWFRGSQLSGACASPRYLTPATDEAGETFTFRFRHAVPPGRYLVRVEVRAAGADRFAFADAVAFHLI